jgi:hypothetical protein
MQFAPLKLHYTILLYGTGELQFALCKLCHTLVQCNDDNLQFELWKLYYAALLCRTVNFSKTKTINFLDLLYTQHHTFQ